MSFEFGFPLNTGKINKKILGWCKFHASTPLRSPKNDVSCIFGMFVISGQWRTFSNWTRIAWCLLFSRRCSAFEKCPRYFRSHLTRCYHRWCRPVFPHEASRGLLNFIVSGCMKLELKTCWANMLRRVAELESFPRKCRSIFCWVHYSAHVGSKVIKAEVFCFVLQYSGQMMYVGWWWLLWDVTLPQEFFRSAREIFNLSGLDLIWLNNDIVVT